MEGQTDFCDTCHTVAYEIDAYYQVLKDSFNDEEQRSQGELESYEAFPLGNFKDGGVGSSVHHTKLWPAKWCMVVCSN